jgi:hypothetical protein
LKGGKRKPSRRSKEGKKKKKIQIGEQGED